MATFEFRSDGKLTEAVGTLGAGAVRRFMIPAEYGSGGFEDVGVAIVNTSASNRLMVKLSLLDESGNVIRISSDPAYQDMSPLGYAAKFISQAFPDIPPVHQGALVGEVVGEGAMAVVCLILKDGTYSAIPVVDITNTATQKLPGAV